MSSRMVRLKVPMAAQFYPWVALWLMNAQLPVAAEQRGIEEIEMELKLIEIVEVEIGFLSERVRFEVH